MDTKSIISSLLVRAQHSHPYSFTSWIVGNILKNATTAASQQLLPQTSILLASTIPTTTSITSSATTTFASVLNAATLKESNQITSFVPSESGNVDEFLWYVKIERATDHCFPPLEKGKENTDRGKNEKRKSIFHSPQNEADGSLWKVFFLSLKIWSD
uniref:Uncharacterized protein n=1 Tax=Megaselia scalaris TaxID=36166 RepID=T1GWU4_MEGSC